MAGSRTLTRMIDGVEGPEVEPQNTKASDVYAFASVCYEMSNSLSVRNFIGEFFPKMFSGNWPFYEIKNDIQIMFTVQSGKKAVSPA